MSRKSSCPFSPAQPRSASGIATPLYHAEGIRDGSSFASMKSYQSFGVLRNDVQHKNQKVLGSEVVPELLVGKGLT
eukprot:3294998-Rhodomonas_salina.4